MGSARTKAIQLTQQRGKLYIKHLCMLPTPKGAIVNGKIADSDLLIDFLKEICQTGKWRGNRLNLSLDSRLCYLRTAIVPEMSKRNLLNAMRLEAENHFPFDIEQAVISYALMQRGDYFGKPACKYLLAATKKQLADAYTAAAVSAGFNPVSLENSALSMLRSLNHFHRNAPAPAPATQIIINCGHETTTLLISNKSQYLYHRSLHCGLSHYLKEIKNSTALNNHAAQQLLFSNKSLSEKGIHDLTNKLASSIKQSLEFCFDNNITGKLNFPLLIEVCGGGIFIPGLASYLQSYLNIKLILHNPLKQLSYSVKSDQHSVNDHGALFITAYGLALRGWLG